MCRFFTIIVANIMESMGVRKELGKLLGKLNGPLR